ERDGTEGEGARGCRGGSGRRVSSRPWSRLDVKLVEHFEPQGKIKNGGKTGEKDGNNQGPPFFCEDQCRQGERHKDEHEGHAYADHLHPIAHWICVPEEKDCEEY